MFDSKYKKINKTVPLGSLNLSDNVKYNNKTIKWKKNR